MQANSWRAAAVGAALIAVVVAASVGLWAGQAGLVRLPMADAPAMDAAEAKAEAAPKSEARKIKFYRNPMGLPDTSPTPKKDAMGMDYIPVYEDEGAGAEGDDGSVKVSPGKIQRTGVETAVARKQAIVRTIRAPGVVALDERRITVIAPRFDGFVESIGEATTGSHVMAGTPLVTVIGQELLNLGARLVVEQSFGPRKDDEAFKPGANYEGERIIGAKRRLLNLGVSEEMIEQIKRERRVPNTLTLAAPFDSIVLERNVVDRQAFKAGDVLFRLADHSVVWMMADVAESDIGALKPGQEVKVTATARPGETFTGKVAVVYPHLTKETRTARVRIELPNPKFELLPDMYGDVEIATGGDEPVVVVPDSALIDSGKRQVVLVDQGEGRFAPRDVKVGRRGDGVVEILDGIAEGDKVVVDGNFLIDAESNLNAALKSFEGSSMEAGQ